MYLCGIQPLYLFVQPNLMTTFTLQGSKSAFLSFIYELLIGLQFEKRVLIKYLFLNALSYSNAKTLKVDQTAYKVSSNRDFSL